MNETDRYPFLLVTQIRETPTPQPLHSQRWHLLAGAGYRTAEVPEGDEEVKNSIISGFSNCL